MPSPSSQSHLAHKNKEISICVATSMVPPPQYSGKGTPFFSGTPLCGSGNRTGYRFTPNTVPKTAAGNKHILVITDHLTRWVEAFPTKNQLASTVARILVNEIFTRFGTPSFVLTDQGASFQTQLIEGSLKIYQIRRLKTSPYNLPMQWHHREIQQDTLFNVGIQGQLKPHKLERALATNANGTSCNNPRANRIFTLPGVVRTINEISH